MNQPTAVPSIRRATHADAAPLADFGARTFTDTFARDNMPEDMAAYLASAFGVDTQRAELCDPRATFLIAEAENRLAGYAKLYAGEHPACIPGGRPIEIARLYVAEEWHGRGVAHNLMRRILDEAREDGGSGVWLGVWERNLRARSFYRKWEFREVGEQMFLLGSDRQRDVVMERALTNVQSAL